MNSSQKLQPITQRFSINESRHLGNGCFGHVYQGYDNQNKNKIAVKHLYKPKVFKDQIETLQKLSTLTHPNIMGFYGYHIIKDNVYLFIQYCPGGTLTDIIKKGIDEQKALNLFRQLVEGMCYMNAKGFIHRDLKPDNILIGQKQDVKISDFGLAKAQSSQVIDEAGTPLYASPEIYSGISDAFNFNCDVWGAGMILHEMLTGNHPLGHIHTERQLAKEWSMFEKGEKRIVYPKNFHSQWQYITNYMLTYNYKKRPMFHDILQLLKKLDDNGTMRKEIRNTKQGIKNIQTQQQVQSQKYLSFLQQKTQVLIQMTKLNPQNFPTIKPSLQGMLKFLAVTWYIIKVKNIIRSLKFKNLKFPNKQDIIDRNKPDEQIILKFDKYRNKLEIKLTKQQNYLKDKVLPLLAEAETKPEQIKLFKTIESAYKLYLQAKEGTYDVEDTYEQQFIKLLNFHKVKPTQQKIKEMNINELRIYAFILTAGFLNSEFPAQKFMQKDFVENKLKHLNQSDAVQLYALVSKLRKKLN